MKTHTTNKRSEEDEKNRSKTKDMIRFYVVMLLAKRGKRGVNYTFGYYFCRNFFFASLLFSLSR